MKTATGLLVVLLAQSPSGVVLPVYRDVLKPVPFDDATYSARCGAGTGPLEVLRAETPRAEAAAIVHDLDTADVLAMAETSLARAAKVLPGATVTLQSIGKDPQSGTTSADEPITDGAVSPSGAWVALRTKTSVLLYRTDDLIAGNWKETSRISLTELREPQGEGISFGDERSIYLVGEGGRKSQPGTFARLTCAF